MADQSFAVPGSSYKELVKVIQAYQQVGKEAVPAEVAPLAGMHETQVSRNNKFLVGIGIVQGGRKKQITPLGAELARALDHGLEEVVGNKWKEVVEANDFLQKVIAAVRIRKGMDESSLEAHVAYSAGQPKTPFVMAGARTIVEILRLSGALREENGNLVAVAMSPVAFDSPDSFPLPSPSDEQTSSSQTSTLNKPAMPPLARVSPTIGTSPVVTLNVQIRVDCTPDAIDELGVKLRKMFDQLSTSGGDVESKVEDQNENAQTQIFEG